MGKLQVKINNKAFATAKAKQAEYGDDLSGLSEPRACQDQHQEERDHANGTKHMHLLDP